MRTPAGKECPYFYGDYFRGRNHEECRLLTGTTPETRWQPSLCQDCPVPDITRANSCEHMVLQARVVKGFLGLKRHVEVEAYCHRCSCGVADPHIGCGLCHPNVPDFIVGE